MLGVRYSCALLTALCLVSLLKKMHTAKQSEARRRRENNDDNKNCEKNTTSEAVIVGMMNPAAVISTVVQPYVFIQLKEEKKTWCCLYLFISSMYIANYTCFHVYLFRTYQIYVWICVYKVGRVCVCVFVSRYFALMKTFPWCLICVVLISE